MITKREILKNILFLSAFILPFLADAQISYGGRPLSFFAFRSVSPGLFEEMPPFDVEAEKRIDEEAHDLRGGFRFAYKFITDFAPDNSGQTFTLPDGTKVWRLGIRSEGAYSINILFSEYDLPQGAKLFLYSPDQSQVLGSFNHLNNSELGLLPVSPVYGDELIIEYQEPVGVDFSGRLRIGEVNHAYRDLRGIEPEDNRQGFACMPPVVCFSDTTDRYDEIARSVLLLVIDGTTLCSGVLVNNTANDRTPYLLTASHCLNGQFKVKNQDYAKVAGSIVSFFNYESPFCDPVLRGTEELSMASARVYAINEKTDMALLGLLDVPPAYYRPYYAGWNIAKEPAAPYSNIHHPWGSVKRINSTSKPIELTSYDGELPFNTNSFWHVKEWEKGSTAGGSSGSPLLDNDNRIIGALTGGQSTCRSPRNDSFYALTTSWNISESADANLKPWLDPSGSGTLTCDGLDPYGSKQALELSNIQTSGNRELSEVAYLSLPETGHRFGVNSLQTREYAEAYTINAEAFLYGAYFLTPPIINYTDLKVDVHVYAASVDGSPGEIIYSTTFNPTFTNKQIVNEGFQETNKPLNRAQETFIKFDTAVRVGQKFFVGYKIAALEKDTFTVYSLPKGATDNNTAWVNYENKWLSNNQHPVAPFKTALSIHPVLQHEDLPIANTETIIHGMEVLADRGSGRIWIKLPPEITKANYELFSIDGRMLRNGLLAGGWNELKPRHTGVCIIRLHFDNKKYAVKVVL